MKAGQAELLVRRGVVLLVLDAIIIGVEPSFMPTGRRPSRPAGEWLRSVAFVARYSGVAPGVTAMSPCAWRGGIFFQ